MFDKLRARWAALLGYRLPLPNSGSHIIRRLISDASIRGNGIEIGALHNPLKLPKDVKVRYVDRLSVTELRKQYKELADCDLVPVDIVADGERLETIEDNSQDFVIANQFIEHCEDPILAFKNFFRVLKPKGVLYLSVPEKTQTFDRHRPVTTLEHLRQDHENGPALSRRAHFEEWSRFVNGIEDDREVAKQADENMARGYSIHFHVWDQAHFFELLAALRNHWGLPFSIDLFYNNSSELIFVLRKINAESDLSETT